MQGIEQSFRSGARNSSTYPARRGFYAVTLLLLSLLLAYAMNSYHAATSIHAMQLCWEAPIVADINNDSLKLCLSLIFPVGSVSKVFTVIPVSFCG